MNGASGGRRPGPPTPCPPRSATRRAAPDRAFTCSAAARPNVPARLSRPFHAPLGQRHLARRPAPWLPVAIAPPGSSLRWSQFPGGRPGLRRLRPQRLCARGAPRPAPQAAPHACAERRTPEAGEDAPERRACAEWREAARTAGKTRKLAGRGEEAAKRAESRGPGHTSRRLDWASQASWSPRGSGSWDKGPWLYEAQQHAGLQTTAAAGTRVQKLPCRGGSE